MAVLFLLSLIVYLFGKRLVMAAVISPSSGSVSFCNDAVSRNFTCEVTGNTLVWVSGNEEAVFGSLFTDSMPLGSGINTHFVSAGGGTVIAIATVTASSGLNGTTLECRNTTGVSNTTARAFVNFTIEASSAATYTQGNYIENGISTTWEGATCVQFYNISVDGSVVATTSSLSYNYTFSKFGSYNFDIISIDYLGNIIGVLKETYYWDRYAFMPGLGLNVDENIVTFTVQGRRINGRPIIQPPIRNCIITVVGNEPQECSENVPVTFNNVMLSSDTNITYNVTIVNDAGVSSYINILSGDVERVVHLTQTLTNSFGVTKILFSEVVVTETVQVGGGNSSAIIGDPGVFAIPFIALGVLIVLSVCWIVLRICWKRQCCCPRIWRSSFWLIFFCYDCCTYDTEEKEGNTIGLKNPNVGGEKGTDTSF